MKFPLLTQETNLAKRWDALTRFWNDHDSGADVWTAVNTKALLFNGVRVVSPIMQIISATATSTFTTTNTSFQVSNLTATITPVSSSDKIFIFACGQMGQSANNEDNFINIGKGGTAIIGSAGMGDFNIVSGRGTAPISIFYLDNPATTSATTYSVMIRSGSGNSVSFGNGSSGIQSMILVEVSGV